VEGTATYLPQTLRHVLPWLIDDGRQCNFTHVDKFLDETYTLHWLIMHGRHGCRAKKAQLAMEGHTEFKYAKIAYFKLDNLSIFATFAAAGGRSKARQRFQVPRAGLVQPCEEPCEW
jgi:hypothetical protein